MSKRITHNRPVSLIIILASVILAITESFALSAPIPPSYLAVEADLVVNTIYIDWRDGADDEDGFKIERQSEHEGSFTQIATVGPQAGSGDMVYYTDENLLWSTSYTYRVRAYNATGDSDYSNTDTASTIADWESVDIGDVGATGSFSRDGGVFTVNGSGVDIWGTSDEFHYVYKPVDGNIMLTARVDSVQNTDGWAKTGVMIRETLDANSKHATMMVTPTAGLAFQRRPSTGGTSENTGTSGAAPRWVRIARSASALTASYSTDGNSWSELGSANISMSNSIYVGLAVTSHNDGVLCQSVFSNISIGTPPPPGAMVVDASSQIGNWSHFYEESVGACHPITVLSSSYGRNIQGALQKGHDEAGFKRFRPHGILNSSVGVYSEPGGSPTYNWTTFDQIYDTVRSLGMYPIVELSHTPPDLASGPNECFWYNGHPGKITPPDNYTRWRDLIREIVIHCEANYGADEVRNMWYFEVYNEPDLPYFFEGTSEDYMRMYDWAAEGVYLADPLVRIGGPATSGGRLFGSDPGFIHPEQFLKHVMQETNFANGQTGTKCDFLSYHRYANDPGYNGGLSKPASMRDYHNGIMDLVQQYNFTGEIFCTEWAPTYDSIPEHSDMESSASFIAKTIHMLNDNGGIAPPDVYSWWVISDIFEEWNAYACGNTPAYGGQRPGSCSRTGDYGLILRGDPNIEDSWEVEKTTFNAFKILHMMGTQMLPFSGGTSGNGINGAATISGDGQQIQVLVYNHVDGAGADSTQSSPVTLVVENIPFAPGQVMVEHYVIDRYHSNSYRVWQNMGSPWEPSASQWATLKAAAALEYFDTPQSVTLTDNTYTKAFDANTYSVSLIVLTAEEPTLPPDPPSSLLSTVIGPNQIDLSWQDNSGNETGFKIERKLVGDAYSQITTVTSNITSYSDTSVDYYTEYVYRVRAYNTTGDSSYSNESSAYSDPPYPPATPINLAATADDGRIELGWSANTETDPSVIYYKVHRALALGGPYTTVAVVFGGSSITDFNVVNDTTYYYRVSVVDTWPHESGESIEVWETPHQLQPPASPSSLSASVISYSEIDLSWTDNSDNELGFRIERKTTGSFDTIGTVSTNITSYSDTGLSPVTTYTYRVYAYNDDGDSDYDETMATTLDAPIPNPPSDLTATASTTANEISLAWTDNSSDEDGFAIERMSELESVFTEITTVNADVTSHLDPGLDWDTMYTYRVRAYNAGGSSAYSNEDSDNTPLPTTPIEETVDDADASITYVGTWNAHTTWGGSIDSTIHETETSASYAEFTFTGYTIELIGDMQPWGGEADIYIDDVYQETVSFLDDPGNLHQQVIYSKTDLAYGEHTIKVEHSGGQWVYVDAFKYTHY